MAHMIVIARDRVLVLRVIIIPFFARKSPSKHGVRR